MLGLAGLLSALAAYLIVSYVQGLRQENAIAVHAEEIFRSPASFVTGNPNGDVSIVTTVPIAGRARPVSRNLSARTARSDSCSRSFPCSGRSLRT